MWFFALLLAQTAPLAVADDATDENDTPCGCDREILKRLENHAIFKRVADLEASALFWRDKVWDRLKVQDVNLDKTINEINNLWDVHFEDDSSQRLSSLEGKMAALWLDHTEKIQEVWEITAEIRKDQALDRERWQYTEDNLPLPGWLATTEEGYRMVERYEEYIDRERQSKGVEHMDKLVSGLLEKIEELGSLIDNAKPSTETPLQKE